MPDRPKIGPEPWLDRFLRSYHERRPVNATFIGVHAHDHQLPDLSAGGVSATISEMRTLLAEDDAADDAQRPLADIDRRLAEGFLRIQLREYESGHFLENPSHHVGEAVFGLMSLVLSDFAPEAERLDAMRARMGALPDFLGQAQAHLVTAPESWTRRALRECRGGLAFLREGVTHLDSAAGRGSALKQEADRAATSLSDFHDFLEGTLLDRPREDVACGPDTFDLYLRDGHFLTQSADEIAEYAREEMAAVESWCIDAAPDFGSERPEDVVAELADVGSDLDGYYTRYGDIWSEMRAVALERDLLTWPDFPLRYVPRPAWSRAAAPDLYFLFYRSPAAFAGPPVHDYLVTPIDESVPEADRAALLRTHNDSVIKLNHVVHHGGIGHHVQNWHAFRSPSRIGRIAAVDCASRIAMYCGATMAEGWACYATDLMAEAGGLTPRERFSEHHSRIRMCARAIVDVELHHRRMSLTEAAAFYIDRAGMSRGAAEAEAVKNSMFPGAALIYLMGTDQIHALRRDLMATLGERFTMRSFHDAFLSYGSIPVRLVADEMKRRAALGLGLGAHDRLTDPAGSA
ncbi:MAG: DUF885 domain-containing protein [Gemmatimonadetes bacterium]|nr:DUF885 domain-containing protein [Gemmatimonadota bacterium]MDA1102318.1 DUF885 domain-containing protein [Gemmatimonadota bacterium]